MGLGPLHLGAVHDLIVAAPPAGAGVPTPATLARVEGLGPRPTARRSPTSGKNDEWCTPTCPTSRAPSPLVVERARLAGGRPVLPSWGGHGRLALPLATGAGRRWGSAVRGPTPPRPWSSASGPSPVPRPSTWWWPTWPASPPPSPTAGRWRRRARPGAGARAEQAPGRTGSGANRQGPGAPGSDPGGTDRAMVAARPDGRPGCPPGVPPRRWQASSWPQHAFNPTAAEAGAAVPRRRGRGPASTVPRRGGVRPRRVTRPP